MATRGPVVLGSLKAQNRPQVEGSLMSETYPSRPEDVIREISQLVHIYGALRQAGNEGSSEDDRYRRAVSAYDVALRRTVEYIEDTETRGARYSKAKESELAKLWSEASIAISDFDHDLANRCFIKGQGWLKPSVWNDKRYQRYKISIDDMREALTELNTRHHAEKATIPSPGTSARESGIPSSIAGTQQSIGMLTALLDRAVAHVPRIGLAWGVVGIAAAAAIVNLILGLNKLALASGFFVFVGMVILFAFTHIPERDRVTRIAAQLLVATIALATVIFIGSSLWAAIFCMPPGFVFLYGLDGVCRGQPPPRPRQIVRKVIEGDKVFVGSGGKYAGGANPCPGAGRSAQSCVRPQHGGTIVAKSGNPHIISQNGGGTGADLKSQRESPQEYCVTFYASTGACEAEVTINGAAAAVEEYEQ